MRTYMNALSLNDFSEIDLQFIAESYATKHKDITPIVQYIRQDPEALLQMIDDEKVLRALTNKENVVLLVSPFLFFLIIVRHAFIAYSREDEFQDRVNDYKESRGRLIWQEEQIEDLLNNISLHLYLANMLSFFSSSSKMNDPEKTQNGWIYITDLIQKLESASPSDGFYIQAFIGNYTLCLTSLYKEYVQNKYRYGKRLVGCEYYASFGEKFFKSASESKVAKESGLTEILEMLSMGYNIVRFALDELKHREKLFITSS
ncbi:MAG: hypothetical protein COA79_06630 [Planctomycetota bacterium]|nr:MAG: hypothetical protein COA79_06630 [Planctomycetota bacterium]